MVSPSDATASFDHSGAPEPESAEGRSTSSRAAAAAGTSQNPQPATHDGSEADQEPDAASEPPFHIGQAVRLRHGVPYLRSAEPMPMLRPADLVDREEVGQVQELRGLGRVAVRFRRGCFLLDAADLVAISEN